MRSSLIFLLILAAAAALSGLLLVPRAREEQARPPIETPISTSSPQAAVTAIPTVEEPPPPPPPPPPPYVRIDPATAASCPEGMLLVNGIYCPFVGHRCRRFASEADDICQSFAPEVLCEGRLQERRFCVDVFEYPNLEGARPSMMVSFDDARRACALEGKRLCTVEEWEFACEGTQMWPYPYGTERDPEACNIDKPAASPDFALLSSPRSAAEGIERMDERSPSGALHRCVSPFGVRDMTGNVAEWVENTTAALEDKPIAALKGGSFQRSSARCRPLVAPPSEPIPLLGVGFRCCADAKGGRKTISIAPPDVTIPRKQVMERPPR
jgi:hypothetical protein